MMYKALIFGACAACLVAGSASATTVSVIPYAYAPVGDTVVDFDSALPSSFTLTGGIVQSGDALGATSPLVTTTMHDTTNYLAVVSGAAQLLSTQGYSAASFYVGSLDSFNTVSLLGQGGSVLQSFTGTELAAYPGYVHNNDRFSFTQAASDPLIYGFAFASPRVAMEIDNVSFGSAVPEPASWAMLFMGFGLIGGVLRNARRTQTVPFNA